MSELFDTLTAEDSSEFPKRAGVPGAGRKRADNPLDAVIQASYDEGVTKVYRGLTEEQRALVLSKAANAAEFLGYGLDKVVDADGTVYLRARVKRVVVRAAK